jgi:hypothetical protein
MLCIPATSESKVGERYGLAHRPATTAWLALEEFAQLLRALEVAASAAIRQRPKGLPRSDPVPRRQISRWLVVVGLSLWVALLGGVAWLVLRGECGPGTVHRA